MTRSRGDGLAAQSMRTLGAGFLLILLLAPASARATPAVCLDAYDHAQQLRKAGKLLDARDALRTCAAPACPALVVSDCTQWLDDVQSSLPSIVPIATDASGANMADVRVSIDGAPFFVAPPGQAIDVDPGLRHLRFERAGAPNAETEVLVVIGQKNKPVPVTMGVSPRGGAASPGSPYRTVGIVVAAAGLATLAAASGLGAVALVKQNDADCPNNVCSSAANESTLRTAGTFADASTALFVVGGVLTAAGVTTWLLAPSRSSEHASWLRLAPMVASGGGGITLGGPW